MKKLYLTFANAEGKKHNLIPKLADENLTGEQVRQAMEDITELSLFEKDGVALFAAVESAKYVEVTETPLF
ncbi:MULTISPECIES: DUF2922 domain-containing protein [Enterococcus]|uniref:DUF2922 domain-containing protein n=1 Tax=Enterococcus TaxID=1350 RepID=UPI0010F743F5|nr:MULTISPECIES: DUF2922 domain-containing protein [Enterococcus]KAF1302984.1 hypothetical protein BAU16_05775 [Enterococcus sp. JM9B]